MWRLLRRVFLILALTVVVVVGGYLWWLHPGYEARPFTSAAWADSDTEGRGHMVNDLLARHQLERMTQEEILGLLGAPDGSMTVEELRQRLEGYGESEEEQRKHAQSFNLKTLFL